MFIRCECDVNEAAAQTGLLPEQGEVAANENKQTTVNVTRRRRQFASSGINIFTLKNLT